MYSARRFFMIFVICNNFRICFSVYWNINTSPVVFGEDVTLTCYRGLNFTPCSECSRRWYGGKHLNFLSYNNITSNSSKYDVREGPDEFNLIIKNFDRNDINIPYKCSYGFDSYKRNFTLHTDIEMRPTNETFSTSYHVDGQNNLHIEVLFKEVHPKPTCNATLSGKHVLLFQTTWTSTLYNMFNVTFNLSHKLEKDNCNSTLDVSCIIGTYTMPVLRSANISQCKIWRKRENRLQRLRLEYNSQEKSDSLVIIAAVVGGILFVVLVILGWRIIISKKNSSKERDIYVGDNLSPEDLAIEIKVDDCDVHPKNTKPAVHWSNKNNTITDEERQKMYEQI